MTMASYLVAKTRPNLNREISEDIQLQSQLHPPFYIQTGIHTATRIKSKLKKTARTKENQTRWMNAISNLTWPKLAPPLIRHSKTNITLTQKSNMSSSTTDPARKLRILMLHGYTQSGPLFHAKTKALEKSLSKAFPAAPAAGHLATHPGGISLHYPTAPIKLETHDIPGFDGANVQQQEGSEAYGWWRRKGDAEPFTYEGIECGLATVAETISNEGPFDGVIGFSQGGAAAGMVAVLLEEGRREAFEASQSKGGIRFPDSFTRDSGYIEEGVQGPLKFAVSYSGFAASTNPLYQAFYEPRISTPMMHFLGSLDTVVSEERSLRLVEACKDGKGKDGGVQRVVYHPGGHFLPSSQKQYVAALVAFIREVMSEQAAAEPGKVEERVEDMDLPF
jgi:pimeloyl-ACP methyl ester carboxylesterase